MPAPTFTGFPKECVRFFEELKRHNRREWFEDHRSEFQDFVVAPAQAFVVEMGERIREFCPKIVADPRTNHSLFRINRDTRFSADKTPYKTHLALWFWEGEQKRMECSGFYFHVEPPNLLLASGIYIFPKAHLDAYRRSVVDPKLGKELESAIAAVEKGGRYTVWGEHYKKTPLGYDSHHPRAALLRYNGLTAGTEDRIPKELLTPDILDTSARAFKHMMPLHRWLVELTRRLGPQRPFRS